MKKFAICLLAIAALTVFVPSTFAKSATTCYHLTYFCDGVQATKNGAEDAFLWDWICLGAGTGQIGIGPHKKFGTYPLYPFNSGTPGGFAANFVFGAGTFSLPATFDGVTISNFQTNSPYTTTSGACNPLGPRNGRSATGR